MSSARQKFRAASAPPWQQSASWCWTRRKHRVLKMPQLCQLRSRWLNFPARASSQVARHLASQRKQPAGPAASEASSPSARAAQWEFPTARAAAAHCRFDVRASESYHPQMGGGG
eukprot:CAMPEP_0119346946 /NCGR_PEP_ID=MMETSP1333-20130426/108266_1 /TAXON_ID=418940 /ORGANISM="Scyphosphaera apsteinii, Strain RCC1455" /LENGTH=114 /DNA_ID=CAMNT_0007359471 /DNA_START=1231 /DNA_END=1575 /DNA_ORIENTATION=-